MPLPYHFFVNPLPKFIDMPTGYPGMRSVISSYQSAAVQYLVKCQHHDHGNNMNILMALTNCAPVIYYNN